MRYIIYARKSTDDEDRQVLSIEAQLKELHEYAQRENLHVCKEVIEAKTAKKPGRPLFNDILFQIERGQAEGVLAWHPDRLARNSVDGGKIIYLIDQKVIKDLRFPTFRFDNNAQGKFMLSIVFGQSKYYIDALSENIRRGIRLKLSKGIWPQWASVGYLNDRKTRSIIIDQGKAPLIRKAFELYSTGSYTLAGIHERINDLGLKTRREKSPAISDYQVMLKNPIYYGVFRYKGETYEGTHEPIITKKLFDKCQQVMQLRGKHKEKQTTAFIFRGLIHCGECGRSITAEVQKGHTYYRCTKRLVRCTQKYIREEELAAQIKEILQKVSLSDDWTEKILNELIKDKNAAVQSSGLRQQNHAMKIKAIDEKISKLIDMYLTGNLILAEYQAKKACFINEKKQLHEDFAAESNNWFEPAKEFVTSLNRARWAMEEGNLESQKEFLKKIGSNFILKERRLSFTTENPYKGLFLIAPYTTWRRG